MADEKDIEHDAMALRHANCLVYAKPDDGSLVNKRTLKQYQFTTAAYALGQTAQCIIQSGGDAVWGPSSYIRIKYTVGVEVSWGVGSIMNIFKNVRLTHRSGEVLEYIQNINMLAQLESWWHTSVEDRVKLQGMIHQKSDVTAGEYAPLESKDAVGTHIACVPLSYLLGTFDNQSQYIPPNHLAGAKLELELESAAIAYAAAASSVPAGFEFTLMLDSAQIYDAVEKQLMDEQADVAGSGLQFTYSTWFNSYNTFAGTGVNFDVQQSASLTQKAVAVIRATADLEAGKDSFLPSSTATQFQWRLGSQYFPQQIVTLPSDTTGQQEAYAISQQAWQDFPHQFQGKLVGGVAVSYTGFQAAGRVPCYATTLEKSASGLQLSGEPTNNSRLLNLNMSKSAVSDQVDIYLQYVRVANVLGANLIIDR